MAYVKEQSYGVVPAYKAHPTSGDPAGEGEQWLFLLVQHSMNRTRAPKEERAGHWAFPKGHAEENESPLETATRELAEEAGITDAQIVEGVEFSERYFFTFEGSTVRKMVTYYLGIVKTKEVRIQEAEIVDYKWATYEEALELATFENAKAMIREANAYLINQS
ncbi:MAG: NUDIX domain-containing protein [Candidatus Spechtbacterales bacterium]